MMPACSELTAATAGDFRPQPDNFLPLVRQPEIRQWALDVHTLWNQLYRVVRSHLPEQVRRQVAHPGSATRARGGGGRGA